MIEKIRAFGESCKVILSYVLMPLAFIAGAIYYLITRNTQLREKIERNEVQNKIEEEKKDANVAIEKATETESDYAAIRAAWRKEHHSDDV